jgi:hypothetical protein
MNMRILLVGALAFAGVVGVAQADTAEVQPVPYHYGMSLKVAKVLSMTEPATGMPGNHREHDLYRQGGQAESHQLPQAVGRLQLSELKIAPLWRDQPQGCRWQAALRGQAASW